MSKLAQAIEKTPDIKGHAQVGKNAIKGEYRSKIVVPNTKLLTCSVDIDNAVATLYPNENRWDYAIEYNKEVFFIEFHPAETSSVTVVLKKLEWLKEWLKKKAPKIDELKSAEHYPYYWIGSGSFNILKTSAQYRRLTEARLLPKTQWNYKNIK